MTKIKSFNFYPKMRSINVDLASLLLILIFFLFLFNETQGIRLGNGIIKPVELLEKAVLEKEIPFVAEGFRKVPALCKNGLICNSGNSRRLLIVTSPSSPTPSTTTNEEGNYQKGNPISKKEEINVKEKELKNSEAGFIDIAEMDYSPATRKPPIHN